jgi:hypothetical protein
MNYKQLRHKKRCPTCGTLVQPVAERFWSKVDVRGPEDCWLWLSGRVASDYGHFQYQGKAVRSHRLAWLFTNGPIPNGLHVLHKCDVRACCNPAHLSLGTHQENIADRHRKGRDGRYSAPGMLNHQARLTDDIVRQIRADKRPYRLVAATHGISTALVSLIKNRKRWAHVV